MKLNHRFLDFYALTTLFLSVPALAVQGGNPSPANSLLASKIIALGEFQNNTLIRSTCSGVIVSKHVIITAAHCLFQKDATQIAVLFGSDALHTTTARMGLSITIPTQYAPYGDRLPNARDNYDIALLRFKGDLPAGFSPVNIVTRELTERDNGSSIFVAGFGLPRTGTLSACAVKILGGSFSNTEFELGSSPSCTPDGGDSGGPDYQIQNNQVMLYGIHNWGWHDQAGSPNLSVEVRMSYFGAWILSLSQ
jgi:hypothetical protein